MAQTKIERKESIAKARAMNHKKNITTKKRLDTYVLPGTKEGLQEIKNKHDSVNNEGEAVDKAVELALIFLKNKK